MVDKTPFFIGPYHVKEDKQILDKEMKTLCHWDIKKFFFSILPSSYVNK